MYNRRLIDYLPMFLQEYRELKGILCAEDFEIQAANSAADSVIDNQFITYADENGIIRYEDMLGIKPNSWDTLAERRSRLLSAWNFDLPYTYRKLKETVAALQGNNNFSITVFPGVCEVVLTLQLESKGQYVGLQSIIKSIMPCNMKVTHNNSIQTQTSNTLCVAGVINSTETVCVYTEKGE